jgi:hypothetical protein
MGGGIWALVALGTPKGLREEGDSCAPSVAHFGNTRLRTHAFVRIAPKIAPFWSLCRRPCSDQDQHPPNSRWEA